ncbi:MAG: PDZ domain-containing protein, partial [Vicinamibacterales bacterium]
EEQDHFKTSGGLLVRELWTSYEADRAGIRVGDVVIALNGLDVVELDGLRAMTSSNAQGDLTVLRQSKRIRIALSGRDVGTILRTAPADAGLTMASPSTPYHVGAVRPGSPAARAGVLPGDRIVRIDQTEPRDLSQVNRLMSDEKRRPMWLEVERGARRLGMLVR